MTTYNKISAALKQGLRPADFEVSIDDISGIAAVIGVNFPMDTITRNMVLCKSATQPPEEMNKTELIIRGHKLNLSGMPVYADFPLGFYNDPEWILKAYFIAWQNANSSHDVDGNLILRGITSTIKLIQYDTEHNVVGGYILYDAFPFTVDGVDNDVGDSDTPQEYTVTFAYSRHQFIPLLGIKDVMKQMNSVFSSISKATLL